MVQKSRSAFLRSGSRQLILTVQKTGGRKDQGWFRMQVIQGLIMSTERSASLPTPITKPFIHHKSADLSRLSGQHFMDVIKATASRMNPMKKCVVCRKIGTRKETRYQCKTCMSRPGLCVVPCFEVFHTETDF